MWTNKNMLSEQDQDAHEALAKIAKIPCLAISLESHCNECVRLAISILRMEWVVREFRRRCIKLRSIMHGSTMRRNQIFFSFFGGALITNWIAKTHKNVKSINFVEREHISEPFYTPFYSEFHQWKTSHTHKNSVSQRPTKKNRKRGEKKHKRPIGWPPTWTVF